MPPLMSDQPAALGGWLLAVRPGDLAVRAAEPVDGLLGGRGAEREEGLGLLLALRAVLGAEGVGLGLWHHGGQERGDARPCGQHLAQELQQHGILRHGLDVVLQDDALVRVGRDARHDGL